MANIDTIKVPNGTSYELQDKYKSGVYFVMGTQTASTDAWTGALHGVSALFEGLTILYYLPHDASSGGNATLNLTLDDGTTTGAINCFTSLNDRLTRYEADSIIRLTYTSSNWHISSYKCYKEDAIMDNVALGDVSSFTNSERFGTARYALTEGNGNKAKGYSSHAEGAGTTANGYAAHAEGGGTEATSTTSHAEGSNSKATGAYSHSEGIGTTANDNAAHAEGASTTASGTAAHSEGSNTTASGGASHSEGSQSTASGVAAHAEGSGTTASGTGSHSEGHTNTAEAQYAHAEGEGNIVSGPQSHVEGSGNTINSTASNAHAEGNNNTVNGANAHAEGLSNTVQAIAYHSHVEGAGNNVTGEAAHAEGINNAAGETAHAEGNGSQATGRASHAEGLSNVASGEAGHSEGVTNTASGRGSHAEGGGCTATGDFAHAEGFGTLASGGNSHAGGGGTIASKWAQTAVGRYNLGTEPEQIAFLVGGGTAAETANRRTVFGVSTSGMANSSVGFTFGADITSDFPTERLNWDYQDVGFTTPPSAPAFLKAYLEKLVASNAGLQGGVITSLNPKKMAYALMYFHYPVSNYNSTGLPRKMMGTLYEHNGEILQFGTEEGVFYSRCLFTASSPPWTQS